MKPSVPAGVSRRRAAAFLVVSSVLGATLAEQASSAATSKRVRTVRTSTTTTPPTTQQPSTTTAAPTTTASPTTTVVPGKDFTFFWDSLVQGPGANIPGGPICLETSLCVSTSIVGTVKEVSGDLIGTLVQSTSTATVGGGRQLSAAVSVFTGAVGGCGVGAFVVRVASEAPPLTRLPAVGERFPSETRFDVIAGSGTKGLVGISGRGTVEFVLQAPNVVRTSVRGRLVCAPLLP